MARTLASMTPEERQQCRGMWCDYSTVNGDLVQVIYRGQRSGLASVHDPKTQDERTNFLVMAQSVTPRFDLPRAWNPDGTPPRGEWVEGHMWWGEDVDTLETVDMVGAECLATGQIQGFDEWPDGVTPGEDVSVRRFITEWEDTDE